MADAQTAARIGFFQRWGFRRAVNKTLDEMKRDGFTGDHEQVEDELFKRLAQPNPETAGMLASAMGVNPADEGMRGTFLDALMKFFTDMMQSSMLTLLIKLIFGV